MSVSNLLHGLNPPWSDPRSRYAKDYPVRRQLQPALLEHLSTSDRRAAVLIGPRQVGKTTLLLQLADDLLERVGIAPANVTYFDFSDDRLPLGGVSPRDVVKLEPAGCRREQPRFFLFDEVSRAHRWAEWLKHAVDSREGRIVVTDSAATHLRAGSRESGLGRWDEYRIEALSYVEFVARWAAPGEQTDATLGRVPRLFERYLSIGGRPEHVQASSVLDARRRVRIDTADRAIRRDLLRHDVDVERVRELFVYLVDDSGAIFDARARARLLARPGATPPDRRTLEKWLRLLEDAMLIARLDPFARAATARLAGRSHPKLYASDHGLVVAFSELAEPTEDPAVLGRVFEAVVFQHLREWASRRGLSLSYARDRRGSSEVDFVIHEGARVHALVEVTAGRDPSRKAEALATAAAELKARRAVVVHGGRGESSGAPVRLAPMDRFLLSPSRWLGDEQ